METLKGKAVYKGIALGKISVLRKTENVVKRVKIEDVDAELQTSRSCKRAGYCSSLENCMIKL